MRRHLIPIHRATLATVGIDTPPLVESKDPTNKPLLTVRSRALIESQENLILIAAKFVRFAIAQIYRKGEELQNYRIDLKHFLKATCSSRTDISAMGRLIVKACLKDVVELPTPTGWVMFPWFTKAEHYEGTSLIDVQFHPEFKQHLLNQKANFLLNDQTYPLRLHSFHSIKMYDFLKSYEFRTEITISLVDLKYRLFLTGKYKEYQNFKVNILDFAQRDLEKETDIKFTYKPIREGRRITKIKFHIRTNKKVIEREETERAKTRMELSACKYPTIREFLWDAWGEYSKQSIKRGDEKNIIEAANQLGKFGDNIEINYDSCCAQREKCLVDFLIEAIEWDSGNYTPNSGWLKNMSRLKRYLMDQGVVESNYDEDVRYEDE